MRLRLPVVGRESVVLDPCESKISLAVQIASKELSQFTRTDSDLNVNYRFSVVRAPLPLMKNGQRQYARSNDSGVLRAGWNTSCHRRHN